MIDYFLGGAVGLMIGLILALLLTNSSIMTLDNEWRAQAIERGYALYCPDNGKFAWKGECDK